MRDFKNHTGIVRAQKFLDKLARHAWEPYHKNEPGFSHTHLGGSYYDSQQNHFSLLWEILARSSGAFSAALTHGLTHLPNTLPPIPPYGLDIGNPGSQWDQFEYEKLFEIIVSDCVTSVADAVVKSTAYLGINAQTMQGPKYYLFRGQSNMNHPLIPRLGRHLNTQIQQGTSPPANPSTVTPLELSELQSFQSVWPVNAADPIDIFLNQNLEYNDSAWWVLMQHFADSHGNGTRMLDVTTSLLFALLFACVDWQTGKVSKDHDGIVYLFVEGQSAIVSDYLNTLMPPTNNLFNVGQHQQGLIQMIINPPHNERSKAQNGGFIWWPEFWKPLTGGLPYLRVPGEHKKNIARELIAFGIGPKEAVRGQKGLANEQVLRSQL